MLAIVRSSNRHFCYHVLVILVNVSVVVWMYVSDQIVWDEIEITEGFGNLDPHLWFIQKPLEEECAGTSFGNAETNKESRPQHLTVGLVANEFFDPTLGRTGGFGMATNMVGKFFLNRPDLNVKVVYIFAQPSQGNKKIVSRVEHKLLGWPLICLHDKSSEARTLILNSGIDVFLTIDYRSQYDKVFSILPNVPVILWARDPRTSEQIDNLESIRLPSNAGSRPQGVKAPKATRARQVFERLEGQTPENMYTSTESRKMIIGVVWMPALRERLLEAYNIPPHGNSIELPNIVDFCQESCIQKYHKPAVIFVGRLDPYKRPWLMVELAISFPNVEFWVLGRSHFDNSNSYKIKHDHDRPLPANVKLLGQKTGQAKWKLLGAAWFLISTSAHEGLAISYLEALSCQTPVLSTVDPGKFVSSYGVFTGEFSGSGMQGLSALKQGFKTLLFDQSLREKLGEEGRKHVLETHNADQFYNGFQSIINRMDLPHSSRNQTSTKMSTSLH